MEFDLSRVKFSRKDLIKGIKIPTELTEELAEDIGLHTGDGTLYYHKDTKVYEFSHSGNIAEKDYMHYVIQLKRNLYNISKIRKCTYGNEFRFSFNSLALATFYSKVIGLPVGKKKDIDVPEVIKNCDDKKIIVAFLRGLIDTDFGLIARQNNGKFHPTLEGCSISQNLILSLQKLFTKIGIETSLELDKRRFHKKAQKYYCINKIIIRKKQSLINCLRIIKPNNGKYLAKINKVGPWRFEFWI